MTDDSERTIRERAQAISRLAGNLPDLPYDDRSAVIDGLARHLDVLRAEHELAGPF